MITPYRVICGTCGNQNLSKEEYEVQMARVDSVWKCPQCRQNAWWDDAWYENYQVLYHCSKEECGVTWDSLYGADVEFKVCDKCPLSDGHTDLDLELEDYKKIEEVLGKKVVV